MAKSSWLQSAQASLAAPQSNQLPAKLTMKVDA
jgi:hypothetical protein